MNTRTQLMGGLFILALIPTAIWATQAKIQATSNSEDGGISVISKSVLSQSQPDFSWIYVQQDGEMTIGAGHSDDWEQLERQGNPYHADYLWVKTAGAHYVITDPAIVAQIKTAIMPMQQQGEKMQAIGEQLQQKGDAINSQTQQLLLNVATDKEDPKIQTEIDSLSASMDVLDQQMNELGKVHESLSNTAEKQIVSLAQAAIKAGAAIKAP
ncbi:hypothetical protein [Shewanella baltica]|uniref:hypothetical protein n=1 Tax=Shewanella baltica TaxID=62322 RepID=UPI000D1B2563|nr:hypothetical protein [Shewanella baltica]AVT47811.1 hypothetical protein C8I07_08675 [Shewanella baltica]